MSNEHPRIDNKKKILTDKTTKINIGYSKNSLLPGFLLLIKLNNKLNGWKQNNKLHKNKTDWFTDHNYSKY